MAVGAAITRIRDMWHHPEDVIVGALLGLGTSMFAFSLQDLALQKDVSSDPCKYQSLNAERVNDASLEDDNDEDERTKHGGSSKFDAKFERNVNICNYIMILVCERAIRQAISIKVYCRG